ncbi:hypothetical protein THIAE_01320 [Thiomicrospira aerophila AL3]|uniref:Uncharacterized protein n=1 Tax=Thiomicrospira aerophila AL3 TaxID=717772 RepID=W0DUB1_9GAMM|nr:hypothetical protein [Thiomicrospira aerophila]AHF00584.1 hypothetical protein THIAE_01320 [Thiomicrospira aerophila AL3]
MSAIEFSDHHAMWRELGVTLWSPLVSNPLNLSSETHVNPLETSAPIIKQPVVLLADYVNDAAGLVDLHDLDVAGVNKLWQDIVQVHFFGSSLTVIGLKAFQDYDGCYELVDRFIEWDVEVLLLFGQHELMAEVLSEGLEVVHLPSLQDLRDSPPARQRCYETLVTLNLLA